MHIPVLLLDPGDFPSRISLDAFLSGLEWEGTITYQGERYNISVIKSILYRRPTHYRPEPGLPEAVRLFAENEASKGFGGLLRSLPCFWMSHPDDLRTAGFKPRQLQRAKALGLRIPQTIITNDPGAARRFYEEHKGNIIYKTLHGRNIPVDEKRYDAIYTSRVTPESLQKIDQVRYTAHLFREHIEKVFEIRATIVGEQIFAAKIYSQHAEAARVDFRNSYKDLRYEVYELPTEIQRKLMQLIRSFNLAYSAIDLAVTPEGEHIFFEINPAGQYHWIEYETKMPITEAIIRELTRER